MDKIYEPGSIESYWSKTWEEKGYFKPSGKGDPYCIVLPPPNVTGSLHMGHAFQDTLMDLLVRYQRMCGKNVLWQPGTDHAGIATQMVVERQLEAEGLNRAELGREAFLTRVFTWKEQSGNTITQQMRRLGTSVDWSRERFTMDDGCSKAVREAFIRLYNDGLIYQGEYLVNWDPQFCTAISDLEIMHTEEAGKLYYLRYPLANDPTTTLTIATTRPETLFGDVAVAVHPEDERYTHLIGQELKLKFGDWERLIPIIADTFVTPEFGSGCVKITPAHDFNDYAMSERHNLPRINILTKTASLNENVPVEYQGLDRFVARKKVIESLQSRDLIEKIIDHTLTVPRGDRSGVILEPYLTTQWYVKAESLAKRASAAVRAQKTQFIPKNWEKTYFHWMDNIQDWCISRQLWWGHRIPVWYDENQKIYVGHDESDVREKYKLSDRTILKQDEDVLDTWFSSALWPMSTLGWPEQSPELNTYYPTSVLVTGFDIIFFWVARMMMFGLYFMNQVPFKTIYMTGLVRDSDGQKMSKSKGNVLDPLDVIDGITLEALVAKRTTGLMQPAMRTRIEKETRKQYPDGIPAYGTDALRMSFCSLSGNPRDARFDLNRVAGYRNFCNKLWNATRFVFMNTGEELVSTVDLSQSNMIEKWILTALTRTIEKTHEHINNYRVDLAAQELYEFVWNSYCDWFLEFSKILVLDETHKKHTHYVLLCVLEKCLRLLHPFMPFITEAIWQRIAPIVGITGDTLMLEKYPTVEDMPMIDIESEKNIDWLRNIISSIRTLRSEFNLSPTLPISVLLKNGEPLDIAHVELHEALLKQMGKISDITWITTVSIPKACATTLVGTLEIRIPLEGLIDLDAERVRLTKLLEKLNIEYERASAKLANEGYVSKAPAEVVEQEKIRAAELALRIQKMQEQIELL